MSFWSSFGPLTAFALVASITPGPNNTMLAASGLNHGFMRSVPHMLGVTLGFVLMIGLVGLGLGAMFERFPLLYVWLKYASAAYLLWLAWKIATASPAASQSGTGQPISFMQAAGFQWVNPKAWIIAIGLVSAYLPHENFLYGLSLACLICGLTALTCVSLWTGFGALMRRWLGQPVLLRGFNLTMAALLVASLYPLMREAGTQ